MYRHFEQNKPISLENLPLGGNMTNFSQFTNFSSPLVFRSFSIKFVLRGTEYYAVNGNEYAIQSGQYLLANPHIQGDKLWVDSADIVEGICIDIAPALLSEVTGSFLAPDTPFSDRALDKFFAGSDFLENKYQTQDTALGAVLQNIGRQFSQNPEAGYQLGNDFYFTLAEKIVADHRPMLGELYGIQTVKHETRKELYRRVSRGKKFLEANFARPLNIADAARDAALSEYHFFRLFKAAFACSPQQYLIRIRMQKALQCLRSGNFSVTETAQACGYADIFHFSQAFKKHYGIAPSGWQGLSVQVADFSRIT